MAWLDIVILLLIFLSMLIGFFKGFVKESISLATWIAAIIIGLRFSPELAKHLPISVETEVVRISIAFAALFIVVLVIGGLINYLISQFVKKTGLSGTDRLLGLIFGALRGGLIVTLLALIATRLVPAMQTEPWWQQSRMIPSFVTMAEQLNTFLPKQLQERLQDKSETPKLPVSGIPVLPAKAERES